MSHSLLKHGGGCGGNLHFDMSKMFSIRTPSVTFTAEGIFVGVTEIQLVNTKRTTFDLTCESCGEVLSQKQFEDEVDITCMLCRENHPSSVVFTCLQISAICADCCGHLSDENDKEVPERLRAVSSWLRVTKDMKLKPYSDILKSNIQL